MRLFIFANFDDDDDDDNEAGRFLLCQKWRHAAFYEARIELKKTICWYLSARYSFRDCSDFSVAQDPR